MKRTGLFIRVSTSVALAILTLGTGGCNSQSRAKGAQSPPPPSLSSPVRIDEALARSGTREVRGETVPENEYAFLKERQVGTSKPLPAVKAPLRARPAVKVPQKNTSARASSPQPPEVYVMKKGDTLYGIARKFKLPPKELIAANTFKNPNRLPVGTKVKLPK